MSIEYRAAVLRAPGRRLSVERVQARDLGPDDVLVKIAAAGLCHTDLEVIEGSLACPVPIVLGHEAAGVVTEVGSQVVSARPGDSVVLSWNPNCGGCFHCRRAQPILCEVFTGNAREAYDFFGRPQSWSGEGEPLHHLMYLGAFAEYCVVPAAQAIPVPREIPLDRACLIGCGVMTGVGAALNVAHIERGGSVLVIGCGGVGLAAVQGARLAGAGTIIAADLLDDKMALARKLGATHSVNAGAGGVVEFVRDVTGGRGADVVLESAGNPAAFRMSAESARPGGEIVWLGKINVDAEVGFRWGSLMQEKRITRSSYGGARPARDFPMLAKRYLDGSLLLDELITGRVSLDGLDAAFDDLRAGTAIRNVVVFGN